MTIKQCIRKNGINYEADGISRYLTVDVDFIGEDGREDETQFDVSASNMEAELDELFTGFSKENHIKRNTVTSITVIASASTLEELADPLSDKCERDLALEHKRQTGQEKYFYDDDGNEYWYTEKDTMRHYTRNEG